MQKTMKKKWVKALRSGEYQQTRGALCNRNSRKKPSYCCLGVLCDVTGLGKWSKLRGEDFVAFYFIDPKTGKEEEAVTSTPISLDDKYNIERNEIINLIHMNDDKGCSFEEIAAFIEEKM